MGAAIKKHSRAFRTKSTVVSFGVLVPLGVFGIHCSPDLPLPDDLIPKTVDCTEIDHTYENFGKAFLQEYCLRCHSVTLESDLSRLDAPLGINFDSMGQVREFESRIRLRAGELGDMPPRLIPGPHPSFDERIKLIEWIECGMLTEDELEGDG